MKPKYIPDLANYFLKRDKNSTVYIALKYAIYRQIWFYIDNNAIYMDKNKCSPIFKVNYDEYFIVMVVPYTESKNNSLTLQTLNNWEF
jgi:hypothetical protein